jgi:hypothetical protein
MKNSFEHKITTWCTSKKQVKNTTSKVLIVIGSPSCINFELRIFSKNKHLYHACDCLLRYFSTFFCGL